MKNKFLLWLLIILSVTIVMQNLGKNDDAQTELLENDLGIATTKTEYALGKEVIVTLQNNTDETLEFELTCPDWVLPVYKYYNGDWEAVTTDYAGDCDNELYTLEPGDQSDISYKNLAYRLFSDYGRYRIDATTTIDGEERTFSSNEFEIGPRSFLGNIWLQGIYRPILNTLVFLIKTLPGHSLGFAIIILTLCIRTLLLVPSQRAMRSQRKMQELQPKLDELKKKYKDNQEKLAMETMNLWKEYKVNPMGSCLPMFIQFPILIALYYVVREGLHIDKTELLYDFVANDFSMHLINSDFLGILDLMEINMFVLPLIVGGLQFIQMNLAMSLKKKKKENKNKSNGKDIAKKAKGQADMQNEMQMATNMMKYFMPVMIAFFTASLPAGVGLYWGTSTTYGIAQQIFVNREGPDKGKKKSEPTVRVIEK